MGINPTKNEALSKISELVKRFNEQIVSYKKTDYNETQTRRDFIDPFFKALGWDVDNNNGYAESYREVIHEDKLKIGTATKAPDYSFRLVGGKRLFFVEAKKPSAQIRESIDAAYQVRRYGWSAGLAISILTDFEEFAVYDCSIRPKNTDSASVARIRYLTFQDYINDFDFVWNTFSKEQVLKGSFDKFIKSDLNKKGTSTVDKEFLQSLDTWRAYLASNISLKNKNLNEEEINFVVQQTINRLIFLRIAEDRNIEPYGSLKNTLVNDNYYNNLFKLFLDADKKYNSGIFDFNKDTISQNLTIDNKTLKSVINELYYPLSSYEFSVIPVEILGTAYEQFLGKVIRLTPAHRVKIEEKPEVRKAGGVYYTPQYIVDYIVENTLGAVVGGQGSVIGGQILDIGFRGSGFGNKETDDADSGIDLVNDENKYYSNINQGNNNEQGKYISKPGAVARSSESGGTNLSSNTEISQSGNIRIDEPDEKSSDFDSIEHSRRSSALSQEGISSISIDSQGVVSGTGNSSDNSSSAELNHTDRNGGNLEKTSNSRKTIERSDSLSSQSNSLIPETRNPKPETRKMTPKEVSKLKILDPACGSGSFLLGAYQFLLDWHKNYYTDNGKVSKGGRDNPLTPAGELTTAEKKRILLNNIYGVDIDYNAVEVTKLSLLLKCLEGETEASIQTQLNLFKERVLPDLDNNIKAGNSLIDHDFYDPEIEFGYEVEKTIKPFNWEQAFPEVFKQGGFDVVIGNPPWGADLEGINYIKSKYKETSVINDSTTYFMEKSLKISKRFSGMIVMNSIIFVKKWSQARKMLLKNNLKNLVNVGLAFEDANIESSIFICDKLHLDKNYEAGYFEPEKKNINPKVYKYLQTYEYVIENKLGAFIASELSLKQKYIINHLLTFEKTFSEWIKEVKRGGDFENSINETDEYNIKYIRQGPQIKRYNIEFLKYIKQDKIINSKKFQDLLSRKIIAKPLRGRRLCFTIDNQGEIITGSNYANIILNEKYNSEEWYIFVLGILNSELISIFMASGLYSNNTETARHVDKDYLFRVPIPKEFTDFEIKQISSFVKQMLKLNKDLQTARLPHQIEQLKSRIAYTDKKIDQLVYELYGLTEEEIKIVEGS